MERLRVQINFSRERNAQLGSIAGTIIAHMTGNEAFTELAADVAKVQTAHVAYIKALEPGPKAGALARAIKDDCRQVLEAALHDLGNRINFRATGNQTMLESSGYPLVTFAGKRKAKKDISLEAGANQVFVSFKGIDGAGAHVVEYTEAPVTAESRWDYMVTKFTYVTVTGLLTGHKYAFRLAGIVNDKAPVFSEPVVSRFVE